MPPYVFTASESAYRNRLLRSLAAVFILQALASVFCDLWRLFTGGKIESA
jgi:hypothetical protein